ncbi:TPA: hypothetical protein NK990_003877 [Vibrio parahaemolyticus]|nr:hypothetical protein [Vibrio parahaemolyticus]
MDLVTIKKVLKRYRNKKLVYGELDCNLMFLEIFEPELFEIMHGRYTTTMGGARVAKKETGHSSIKSLVEASDKYTQKSFNAVSAGDILINGMHVAICLGHYTFNLEDDTFKLIETKHFSNCLVFSREQ